VYTLSGTTSLASLSRRQRALAGSFLTGLREYRLGASRLEERKYTPGSKSGGSFLKRARSGTI